MPPRTSILCFIILLLLVSCASAKKTPQHSTTTVPSPNSTPLDIHRKELVSYAKEFLGASYVYGAADPAKGFDCSGLVYYVFKHFGIKAPRSSYEYENMGSTMPLEKARPGDLILFTAENSNKTGHIGIITAVSPQLQFIHASGSKTGVIISAFTGYYVKHFVKVVSVLK